MGWALWAMTFAALAAFTAMVWTAVDGVIRLGRWCFYTRPWPLRKDVRRWRHTFRHSRPYKTRWGLRIGSIGIFVERTHTDGENDDRGNPRLPGGAR